MTDQNPTECKHYRGGVCGRRKGCYRPCLFKCGVPCSDYKSKVCLMLILKGKWYDMIESGEKREEYRDLSRHWVSRIWCHKDEIKAVTFHRGYTNTTMTFEVKEITVGKGNPAWGAPEEEVFIIKLGQRI